MIGNPEMEELLAIRAAVQILWALVDGAGQTSIDLRIGGDAFDLLA